MLNRILKFTISALLLVLLSSVFGCKKDNVETSQEGDKLRIVTTIPPLYAHTKAIVGDLAIVENLVTPGQSAHTFDLTPAQAKSLAYADIVIVNGLDLEEFLADFIANAEAEGTMIVDASEGIPTIDYEEHSDEDEHHDEEEGNHEEEADEHHHDGADPHVWLSPTNAMAQVKIISAAIMANDPANASTYNDNTNYYLELISKLKTELSDQFATTKPANFIVFHDAYRYFLREYNLESYQKGILEVVPGTEPSLAYLKKLTDLISEGEVKIIFTEPQFPSDVAKALADKVGRPVGVLDPLGSALNADGYLNLLIDLKTNLTKL